MRRGTKWQHQADDPEEGTSHVTQLQTPTREEEAGHRDLKVLPWDRNFMLEQRNNPTLSHAYEQLAPINGVTESQRGERYPHFALKKELLYRIEKIQKTGVVRD